ncbi:MAG TPA: fatty acid desaturase [Saprospiraceae bacterium]|nr:fatty acid desaturase [Saprospiraceae bacterium]
MGELSQNPPKTIRFRDEARDDAFFLELRQRVQDYLARQGGGHFAPPLLWFKAAIYLAVFGCLYALLYAALPTEALMLVWAALGLFGVLLGLNVSHDAAHDAFFRNKKANAWLYYFSFSLLGTNAYLWKLRHVQSHHLFPNVDDCDADIDDNPLIRLSPGKPWRWHHTLQHWYAPVVYLCYSLIWVFIKDFILLQKKQLANLRQIKHPAQQIWAFYLAKIAYLGAFIAAPMLWGHSTPAEIGLGFLLMHMVSGSAFIYMLAPSHFSEGSVFAVLEPGGYLPGSWSRHQLATSLDYHATSCWANWVFGGFNAHAAHHLFPGISHAYYPVISRQIRNTAAQYGIPYRNVNWFQAVRLHFRYLKALGEKPDLSFAGGL